MFDEETIELIKKVLLSWQVIAVTLVILFYNSIVFYVARLDKPKKRFGSGPRSRVNRAAKKATRKPPKPAPSEDEDEDEEIHREEGGMD